MNTSALLILVSMRAPESAINFDSIEVIDYVEYAIYGELQKQSEEDNFEADIVIPGPGPNNASLHISVLSDSEMVLVTLYIRLSDLLSLDRDWDGFTYPKPRKSPEPYVTELGDHGDEYARYGDVILSIIMTELGLKPEIPEEEAYAEDGAQFICQGYTGAHQSFGPALSESAPFLIGLKKSAFWELDKYN